MNILFYFSFFARNRTSSGQALAEILFALAIAILLINGLVVAMRSGISNSQFSQHKIQSVHLAQASIERARALRDGGEWDGLNTSESAMGDTGGGAIELNGTEFQREVEVSNIVANMKRVTVTIRWNEFDRPVTTQLSVLLTQWR